MSRSDDAHGPVLAPVGELDLASAPQLEEALREVEVETYDRLLLDLSQLMFMDSTGLAVLVGANERADADGRRFALRAPTTQVQRLLALVGLVSHLVVEE